MESKLNHSNTVSAPCKIHLLGEHSVVYGKPAILTSVNLRVTVTISPSSHVIASDRRKRSNLPNEMKKIIEPIIKKHLKIKKLPPYNVEIKSDIPIGAGLGSSAAISASYIAALLSFLKVKWDLNLIYNLTYEAEKIFHGNPSGGDQSAVIFGGLIWFRKETPELKIIQPLPFSIPSKLAKNFILINTGKPKEITAEMVKSVRQLYDKKPKIVEKFLDNQERLVREFLPVIKDCKESELIRIIKAGQKNLESIGVVSKSVHSFVRTIEQAGGAAKISGAGGKAKASGILLAYHSDKQKLIKIVQSYKLSYFTTKLGVEGLRVE